MRAKLPDILSLPLRIDRTKLPKSRLILSLIFFGACVFSFFAQLDIIWRIILFFVTDETFLALKERVTAEDGRILSQAISLVFAFGSIFYFSYSLLAGLNDKIDGRLDSADFCKQITRGRTFDRFNDLTRTSSIKAIHNAIEYCWKSLDWGRIPTLSDLIIRVVINNDQQAIMAVSPIPDSLKERTRDWRWLRVDHSLDFKLDLNIASFPLNTDHDLPGQDPSSTVPDSDRPNGSKQNGDFFAISGQTPADMAKSLIPPIAVLPFEDYAEHAEKFDGSMSVIYPVPDPLRIHLLGMSGGVDELRQARQIAWLSGPSPEFTMLVRESDHKDTTLVAECSRHRNVPMVFYIYESSRGRHCVTIPYRSIFNPNGEIDTKFWKYVKSKYTIDPAVLAWIEIGPTKPNDYRGCYILGMYFPDFRVNSNKRATLVDQKNDKFSGISVSEFKSGQFVTAYSLLTVEEAKVADETIYSQNAYDFAVGWTARFKQLEVRLHGDLWIVSHPGVSVYSLRPYAPSFTVTEKVRKLSDQPKGTAKDTLFYPSDSFSIRWARVQPKAATGSDGEDVETTTTKDSSGDKLGEENKRVHRLRF